jgi:hypothetical protein
MRPEQARAERFPPGEGIGRARPGDFILVRGTSWRSRVIAGFERSRFRRPDERDFSYWTHAALVVSVDGALVEAGTAGVVVQHIEKYRDDDYHYVAIEAAPADRWKAVRFAASRVGASYSRLAIVGLAASMVTRRKIALKDSSWDICAGLVARALDLRAIGLERGIQVLTPGDLARHFGVRP